MLLAALLALLCSGAPPAWAHPLGDFTVNTHLGMRVEPAAVSLDVVLDIAEIPTLRAFPDLERTPGDPQGKVAPADRRAYQDRLCPALRDAVRLELAGTALALAVLGSSLSFPAGDGGLATTRLECRLRTVGQIDAVGRELTLTDSTAVQPAGWREITAVGDGVRLAASDVPSRSPSQVLRSYPPQLLSAPLDQRTALLRTARGTGVVTGAGQDVGGDRDAGGEDAGGEDADGAGAPAGAPERLAAAVTDLVADTRIGVGSGFLAVALAVLLGALHAFAPGHGKTLMAAYLVGRDGSLRQAALLGLAVTLTHTLGVLLLGVVVSTAALAAPERVYPWLGLAAGVLVTGVGLTLLRAARRAGGSHPHAEPPGHQHAHHQPHGHLHGDPGSQPNGHPHGDPTGHLPPAGHHADTLTRVSDADARADTRTVLAVGLAGGLVPAPSALVVLLGGVALGRAVLGVLLVVAYGTGMALALVGTGLVLVRARDRAQGWSARRSGADGYARVLVGLTRRLPVLTAGLVVVVGLVLVGRAVVGL